MSVVRPSEIPDDFKPVYYALISSGVFFTAIGVASFLFPSLLYNYVGLEGFIAKIFAGQLVIIGLIDLLWLPGYMLKLKEKQKNKDHE